MLDNLKDILFRQYGSASLYATRKSPELLLAAGLGTGLVSMIMLAKAHRKSDEVFSDLAAGIAVNKEIYTDARELQVRLEEALNDGVLEDEPSEEQAIIFEEDYDVSKLAEIKAAAPLYVVGAQRAALLYGPAVITGIAAVMLILASHNKLQKRNRSLVGALTLLQTSFIEYRRRVSEEYGEEAEKRIYYGLDKRTIKTVEVGKDGKKKKKKSEENVLPEEITPIVYQKKFDQTNQNWSPDPDIRFWTLFQNEATANLQLQMKGWVLLNEVYSWLGMSETTAGAVVGWSREMAEAGTGDASISFGLEAPHNQIPGQEAYLLDFNVHGPIIDYIDPESEE